MTGAPAVDRTTEQWLLDGVCGQGHALYGPADLYRYPSGKTVCDRCRREMNAEQAALRARADERALAGDTR